MDIKLSKYAIEHNITYRTAHNWFKAGKIPNAYQKEDTHSIFVTVNPLQKGLEATRVVIYARVSSHEKKDDLFRQVERCKDYAAANGYKVDAIYKEIASGMNDNRPKFWEMLSSEPTTIICENKDRLTRFGFNYIERLLSKNGCSIDVMYPNDNNEQDIIKDMIAIVTSFCCRLYGARRAQNKIKRMKLVLESDKDE